MLSSPLASLVAPLADVGHYVGMARWGAPTCGATAKPEHNGCNVHRCATMCMRMEPSAYRLRGHASNHMRAMHSAGKAVSTVLVAVLASSTHLTNVVN